MIRENASEIDTMVWSCDGILEKSAVRMVMKNLNEKVTLTANINSKIIRHTVNIKG